MKKKNEIRLYNVLFPVWMIFLFPHIWLIIIPGNFIIDSLVLLISMKLLGLADKKLFYKRHIAKIFIFGMLSDIFGTAYMLLMMTVFNVGQMGDELYLTAPALLIAAVCIFVFNYFFTFKKDEGSLRLKLSLVFALVTAPYTYMIPSSWIY